MLHTTGLEAVEFLPGLPVEVLAVHDEKDFFNVGVVLKQDRGLEGGESLAAAGGVPDVAVATVLLDTFDDRFDRVDLVRPHHHQLALSLDQYHVAADHLRKGTLCEECIGEVVEVRDFLVLLSGPLVDGQKPLVGIETEIFGVIVGEIPGIAAVADDEKLHEAEQRVGVAVARIVLVLDNLLHRPTGADLQTLKLDLHQRQTVDEQNHIVSVEARLGVDAKLVYHLEAVLTPIFDVDKLVVQWRPVFAFKIVDVTQGFGTGEDIGADYCILQPGELSIG